MKFQTILHCICRSKNVYHHKFCQNKIYDKWITKCQFSYHRPYQPSTPTSALDSRISPREFGPRTPYLKLLQHMTLN